MELERAVETQEILVLKTLLICDLVASTRLVEDLGDQAASAIWRRHDRLARDLLKADGGREIDKTDGFLMLFERPLNAVLFALAYHDGLRRLSADVGRRIQARVGIHLGEVMIFENPPEDVERGAKPLEVEGLAKPMAARLMSLARGSQTLITHGAFDLARRAAVGLLDGEKVRWLSHGEYRFKGMEDAVEVFEVGREGRAPLAAPPETDKARRAARQATVSGWRPAPGLMIPHRPHWKVERRLGEGGFGEVWLGVHSKTHERRVFKFCYDADRLRSLQREITVFRLLKEELGERDDIARILDWSFDEAPYFIESEYTAAGNLEEWLTEQGGLAAVPLATRLEIVAQVASALAAAHSVGVLHKDVKPANVLISQTGAGDGKVQAQLADFGIGLILKHERLAAAGITAAGITGRTSVDLRSYYSGTPLYVAPEILEGKPATLQGDIYALGVMLYQLVVGDLRRALASGWHRSVEDELLAEDIARFVDGSPDRRPSTALEVAERLRNLESRRAEREAERRRREEAEAARQALRRSQRRRKIYAVLAAGSIAVLVVVSVLAFWAMNARRQEEKARRGAERVLQFMVDLFETADPFGASDLGEVRGDAVTAREILDRGAERIANGFADDPLIRARLMNTLGSIYTSLGALDRAEPLLEEALAVRRRHLGEEHPDVAESLGDESWLAFQKGDFKTAESLMRQALAMMRRFQGDENVETAAFMNVLGVTLWMQGDYEDARPFFEDSLAVRRRLLGAEHPDVAQSLHNLSFLLQATHDYEGAEAPLREALAMTRRLRGAEHPTVAIMMQNLAFLLQELGNYDEAERLAREALAIMTRAVGEDHPWVAQIRSKLAGILVSRGEGAEAEAVALSALENYRTSLAPEHWEIAFAENSLGGARCLLGRYDEAEELLSRSYANLKEATGPRSPYTLIALDRLVGLYERWGKPEKAAEYRALKAEAAGESG